MSFQIELTILASDLNQIIRETPTMPVKRMEWTQRGLRPQSWRGRRPLPLRHPGRPRHTWHPLPRGLMDGVRLGRVVT